MPNYHFFGAKDGALYVDALAAYQAELLALLGATEDDAERGIRGAVEHHLAWVEANPDGTRTLFEHRQALERSPRAAVVREQNRGAFRATGEWLAQHVAAGAIRDLDAAAAAVWLGPAQVVAREWIAGRLRGKPTALAPELAESAWRAFRA